MGRSMDVAKAAAGIVVGEEDFAALVHTLQEGWRCVAWFVLFGVAWVGGIEESVGPH
jgi:hypothetical protein